MLKPRHRLGHQFRVLMQIPVGVVQVGVPEICGQRGQAVLGVGTGGVASPQDLDRHRMPHVVQTRPISIRDTTHADPFGQPTKRAFQRRMDDAAAMRRYEEGFDHPAVQEGVTFVPVALQDDAGRLMDGHEPGLAELRVADGNDALIEIDVIDIEVRTSPTRIPVTLSRP